MKYVRKWKCAQCNEAVIIDAKAKTQSCGCGTYPLQKSFMVTKDFDEKYELLCM